MYITHSTRPRTALSTFYRKAMGTGLNGLTDGITASQRNLNVFTSKYVNRGVMKEIKDTLNYTYRTAKRIVIAIVGGSVLLVGIAFMVLPGPAFVVIPAGLAILSIEFAWARRWLRKVKEKISEQVNNRRGTNNQ